MSILKHVDCITTCARTLRRLDHRTLLGNLEVHLTPSDRADSIYTGFHLGVIHPFAILLSRKFSALAIEDSNHIPSRPVSTEPDCGMRDDLIVSIAINISQV